MYKQPIPQVSQTISIPAPTGGLNTREPLAKMGEQYAVQLRNAIPTSLGVSIRKGYKQHNFLAEAIFNTLIPYTGAGSTPDRLFAISGTTIYDATVSGTITPSLTGLAGNKAKYVQMSNQGGQFLVVCTGLDAPLIWTGSAWIVSTLVPSPAAPGEWSHPTLALEDLTNPVVHQKRLWWVKKGSTRIVYSEINSVGGELTTFDVGGLLPRGGQVVDLISWSADNGSGMQNRLAVLSSEGDIVLFDGIDPSDATTWICSGTWSLTPPAYDRPFLAFDGDVFYFSKTGIYPLSQYLQNTSTVAPISANIRNTIGEMARTYQGIHGFDMISCPSENLLIINIPQVSTGANVQFCMNTETAGWCLFTGIGAASWANLNGKTYFCGNNKIHEAFTGYKDDTKAYTSVIQQAFTNLGISGANKHVSLVRANLIAASTLVNLKIDIKSDFDVSDPNSIPSVVPQNAALWDTSMWDMANWGNSAVSIAKWNGANASGVFISVIIVLQAQAETIFTSSDLVFQVGGILS